jgi:hypothetical protein
MTMKTTTILLDKISSVTRNAQLAREVRLGAEIPCEEGVVVAARVLHDKVTYNQMELPNGRMAQVKRGDVVAGCLGHRNALFGYSGRIPASLAPGDRIHILNLGGVMGICDGVHPDLGAPFECEVLGSVLTFPVLGERITRPARIGPPGGTPLAERPALDLRGVPVVAVMGSCMNAGKTAAAVALTRELAHRGLVIDGAKATGVSLRRDILALEDAGARTTAIFTDLGIVSTSAANAAAATRMLLTKLAGSVERPDLILLELGDGILGAYGVDAILADVELRASFTASVFAANDPVAAWGGVELLRREYGFEPTVITGPATDNKAGGELIEKKVGISAANARTAPERLTDLVAAELGRQGKLPQATHDLAGASA